MFFLNIEPSFATVAAVALTFYLILYRLQTVKSHPDEPPIIPSAVPYVGHLLGMALKGGRYIKQIGLVPQRVTQCLTIFCCAVC